MNSNISFRISGIPATYSTAGERAWKNDIASQAHAPSLGRQECGIILSFDLISAAPMGKPVDVDNLCEPVFSVLVNSCGWFAGSRPRISWWIASKRVSVPTGCDVTVSQEAIPDLLQTTDPDYDVIYRGAFPTSAKSVWIARWAWGVRRDLGFTWIPESCGLSLEIGDATMNIGDIATGRVKAFIDCLYPWLGGVCGHPDDHRVTTLLVRKAVPDVDPNAVRIRLWANSKTPFDLGPEPKEPLSCERSVGTTQISSGRRFVQNPCRIGTCKYMVCEAALRGATIGQLQSELEHNKPGAGSRWREYMSDLRGENHIDIRVEGDRLVCVGYL